MSCKTATQNKPIDRQSATGKSNCNHNFGWGAGATESWPD